MHKAVSAALLVAFSPLPLTSDDRSGVGADLKAGGKVPYFREWIGGISNAMTETAPQNTPDHVSRLPSGRWAPGRSPNPGGRPKIIADVRDLARQHTQTALDTLVEICRYGKTETARVAAANSLLDRGYGKPPVSLELREPDPEQIIELIADAERHARELFAAPLAITDADNGARNEDAPPVRHGLVRLGHKAAGD